MTESESLKIILVNKIYKISNEKIDTEIIIDTDKGNIENVELFFKKLIIKKEISGFSGEYKFEDDLKTYFDDSQKNIHLKNLLTSSLEILNNHSVNK